jgi:hypothetical protein
LIRSFGRREVRLLALGLSAALLIALTFAILEGRQPPLHKGTWIWEADTISAQRERILDFAKRNGVTHIYLYVDRGKVAPKEYAQFIGKASEQGIKVEALGGDPSWGWKDKRPHLQSLIEWVASYNTNVNENERFSALHLDIEPYLLPEWETERPRVIEEWLSNLEFADVHADWIGGLDVSVDVPFWIHKIGVPGYEDYAVSTWMLKRFETVVLMDYRDTAEGVDGIIANALSMVDEASAKEKSVVIGVEIAPNGETEKTTFFEEGSETMEQELMKTRRYFNKNSGFQGIAVHGFSDWMSLHRKGESF